MMAGCAISVIVPSTLIEARPVTYTVWMHGQQIGETKLEYRHTSQRHAGAFHPTEFGLTMLPGITAMGPALFAFGDMCQQAGIDTDDDRPENASAALDAFARTPEGQRVIAAAKQIAEVEVRDSNGKRVTWESLAITDLEWMVAVARKRKPQILGEVDALSRHDTIKFMITMTVRSVGREPRGAAFRLAYSG
jgi:hypothetical protein